MTTDYIPFNRPYATGNELVYAAEAQRNYHLSGEDLRKTGSARCFTMCRCTHRRPA